MELQIDRVLFGKAQSGGGQNVRYQNQVVKMTT